MVLLGSDFNDESERSRLTQLARARMAMTLNNVHHVRMSKPYFNLNEHMTVYVLDVFSEAPPRGLPKSRETLASEQQPYQDDLRARYQVEHRYSAFRVLRDQVGEAVAAPKGKSHPRWCPYCSRVRALVKSGLFPSRFQSELILREYVVQSRSQRLEAFVNQLLRAAKDISYCSGCKPCDRFGLVSMLLNDFLAGPNMGGYREEQLRN
jgi:hypothetical protein